MDNAAPAGRVFISYASQDGAVAGRICSALEQAGFPCWMAPRDVRPGEPYAAAIVEAINACRLVVLVLTSSAIGSPHVLREVERASSKKRPVLSIRLDAAPLLPELEYFLSANQWLEAAGSTLDSVLPALIDSVRARDPNSTSRAMPPTVPPAALSASGATVGERSKRPALMIGAAVAALAAAVALGWWLVERTGLSRHDTATGGNPAPSIASTSGGAVATSAANAPAFAPPPHSIAVLPFVNMSGDPKQDYFSDGLSEELLNSLASVRDLRVAARTSSFFFKGKEVDLSDVARKLNVGAVLEGSVRKDGDHVRITAQLIDAVSGYHLWSQTYDRDLKDILKLQTDVATAVTKALQATLLANAAATIELGGTQNPQAFDAYLRGKNLMATIAGRAAALDAIAAFTEAVRLDPNFASMPTWR